MRHKLQKRTAALLCVLLLTAALTGCGVKKDAAPTETLMKKGEYSFVSGFKDARTVEVKLEYDALRFGFDVIGEDFLS